MKNCVIWTRVSTKYQEDNGGSLSDQKNKCELFARQNGYVIKGYFGGTHESAKTPGVLVKAMFDVVYSKICTQRLAMFIITQRFSGTTIDTTFKAMLTPRNKLVCSIAIIPLCKGKFHFNHEHTLTS